MTPSECLHTCFASTFGLMEYEQLARSIVKFLAEGKSKSIHRSGWGEGSEWERQFTIEDVTDSPHLFAMFAAAGWLQNTYFPKGGFVVSKDFIERVTAEQCSGCRGSRITMDKCSAGNSPSKIWH